MGIYEVVGEWVAKKEEISALDERLKGLSPYKVSQQEFNNVQRKFEGAEKKAMEANLSLAEWYIGQYCQEEAGYIRWRELTQNALKSKHIPQKIKTCLAMID